MRLFKAYFLFSILLLPIFAFAQEAETDALKLQLQNSKEDTSKVELLLKLSENYYRTNPFEAVQYTTQAINLSKILEYPSGEAYGLKYMGLVNYRQDEYVQAVRYWEQALEIFERIGEKEGIANMLTNLGVIYSTQGNEARALESYFKSLKLAEEIQDTGRIVATLNNIGLVYTSNISTQNLALENYQKGLELSEKINYYEGIGSTSDNIGEFYYNTNDYNTALTYFEKSLEAYRKTKSTNITTTLTYLGKIYTSRKEFQKAIKFQEEAYKISEKSGTRWSWQKPR